MKVLQAGQTAGIEGGRKAGPIPHLGSLEAPQGIMVKAGVEVVFKEKFQGKLHKLECGDLFAHQQLLLNLQNLLFQ